MNRKVLAVCTTALLAMGLLTPALAANAAPSKVLTIAACIPSPGSDAYDETIIDQAAVDLWYSWTGGPSDTHDFPGADGDWQVDQGNHNGFDQSPGLLQRDKGNSGQSDWFYHQVIAEQTHPVHHDAVPPVVCDPEQEQPHKEISLYCYDKLNADLPAAWENSGIQTLVATKLGDTDWTDAEKRELCNVPEETCTPGAHASQSDAANVLESFEWPEHIQYPTDNIGWPPIYWAHHTDLTQTQSDDAICDPPEIVQFSAPTFNLPERCDLEGSIITPEIRGVIWNVIFDALTGAYTVDASPDTANNFAFEAEVQTHWEGNLGALEPCPQIAPCDTNTVNPTATNKDPRGWEFEGAEWTKDGLLFTASNWSDAYAFHTTNFTLSQATGLGLDLAINGDGVWAVILQTAAGNIHYEPAPYTLDLWTNAPGILPASPGGQGGDYAGNLEDIIGDPTITGVYLYFSSGSESPVTALLSSGSYNCTTQLFAAAVEPVVEEPPTTPPTLPISGATFAMPLLYTGGALLLAGLTLGGIMLYRRKVSE